MTAVRVALLDDEGAVSAGRLTDRLVPLLERLGARMWLRDVTRETVRLDEPPTWDLTVLKSSSAAALHVAAAAEGWGVPCLDPTGSVRIARDRIATWTALDGAGVPLAPWRAAWIGNGPISSAFAEDRAGGDLVDGPIFVKAARGSRGRGIWTVAAGELRTQVARIPSGPYLLMAQIPHDGPDLKVYVAGDWVGGLERCYPAETLEQKRGRRVGLSLDVIAATRRVGAVLGLSLYGCDFVRGADGWQLVDVNPFPGYKGIDEAADAIAARVMAAAGRLQGSGGPEPARPARRR